jgi:hypothetical protein
VSIIKEAIKAAGGPAAVGRSFGIGRVSVYEWIYKDQIPPDRVLGLAALTDWKYTPHRLAPARYPNPGDGLPP